MGHWEGGLKTETVGNLFEKLIDVVEDLSSKGCMGKLACAAKSSAACSAGIGGWSDFEMVRRYAHLSVEHLAEYAERLTENRLVSTVWKCSRKEIIGLSYN